MTRRMDAAARTGVNCIVSATSTVMLVIKVARLSTFFAFTRNLVTLIGILVEDDDTSRAL